MSFFNNIFGSDSHKDTAKSNVGWNELTDLKQLEEIASESSQIPVITFKHSTRCGISRMALKGFEAEYSTGGEQAKPYYRNTPQMDFGTIRQLETKRIL